MLQFTGNYEQDYRVLKGNWRDVAENFHTPRNKTLALSKIITPKVIKVS